MKRAKDLFSESEKAAVSEEIRLAESKTSGEIVVVVADSSSDYGRAAGLFALLTSAMALALSWPIRDIPFGLPAVFAILILSYQLGLFIAERFPILKMIFVDTPKVERQVERASAIAYQRFRVARTVHSSGMLIFVSLQERKVRVVGDGAITAKLEDKDWQEVCRLVTRSMADGKPAEGLVSAVRAAGELLARHFPSKLGDSNELPNTLNLIDGVP